jgi:hypothetical protein
MSKYKIKQPGYKHSMMKQFIPLLTELEVFAGEQNVNVCRYESIKYHPHKLEITVRYIPCQGIARIIAKYDGWMQVFNVTIAEQRIGELESLLSNSSDPHKIEPD